MRLSLNVAHISKSYNDNVVLDNCSFSFDTLSTYVLAGPNGSGKSTFLRICSLIERPDGGTVDFLSEGVKLEKDINLKRRITLMLPRVGLFNTTVIRNAAYGLRLRDTDRKTTKEKAYRALEFVGLADKAHQNAHTLSSGEAQRLGIARALVVEPDILLLDEPTASVDQKNTGIIEEILFSLKSEKRSLVIMTTHDRDQARRLADHLLMMRNGKITVI